MSYGRSYNDCGCGGYQRRKSYSQVEPQYYNENQNCCCQEVATQHCCPPPCPCPCPQPCPQPCPCPYPQPWPPCPPRPFPPCCPTGPSNVAADAFLVATSSVPTAAGTALTTAPTTVIFNTPLVARNMTASGSTITFQLPGTYYVEFQVPVTDTAAGTITINTTGVNATAAPNSYSFTVPGDADGTRTVGTYSAIVTSGTNGTLTYTITSSDATATAFPATVVAFKIAD